MASPGLARARALSLRNPLAALPARLRTVLGELSWPGEPALVLGLAIVALVAHGLNMFHYPSFTLKEDEGIYAAQAWAVLRLGQLSPYTYFYDHAPGGWILIAAWMWLTGGVHTFGGAIDSGRMLVLVLHLAMVPLLYHLTRKFGCSAPLAALAVLLFSVSPLAVFFQRLLLLDNIMLFWILLSLDLLLNGWGRLSRVVLSGALYGVALLSKETAIFLVPAMVYIAFLDRRQHQGRFAVVAWLLPMAIVVSWYPLFALLKGELWPAGGAAQFSASGYGAAGVSLLDSLLWQASRDGGGLLNLDNQFWRLVRTDWLQRDALLFLGGVAATFINLLRGWRERSALAAALLGLLPLAYLARGGLVLDFYVLFALPFFCLNIAVALRPLLARLPGRWSAALAATAAVLLVLGYWRAGLARPLYEQQSDQAGREALAWIKQHVPPDSLIITRDDLWTDLREPGPGGPGFPNVHSHWKVAADPAIRGGVFHDDWRMVDYLIMSPRLEQDFIASNNTVALEALRNAHLVRRWASGDSSIELWKVDRPGLTESGLLQRGAAALEQRFERQGAYVRRDGSVTSESQAYAMLRAVWLGDRAAFDRAWGWTRAQLADQDGLLAWLWRDGGVQDAHTASDADTDAALALLMAGRRWGDPELLAAGRRMVQAVWRREVAIIDGQPYLTAGDWAPEATVVALNPSYFAPYAYRIFQEVDPEHDWLALVTTSYRVLYDASSAPLGGERAAGLPPDWVGLERGSGQLVPIKLDGRDTTSYGYDAARTYWRIALDLRWSGDGRAEAYLRQAGFLRDEVARKGFVSAVYGHDGSLREEAPSMVGSAGALAALLTLDPAAAHGLFASQIVGGQLPTGPSGVWGDPSDLYAQEWGWFATALYADALPDLWHGQPLPTTTAPEEDPHDGPNSALPGAS